MRYLIVLCLVALMTTACNQVESRYSTAGAEIDQVKDLIANYEAGDWEAWLSHYADTAKVYHNSTEPSSAEDVKDQLAESLQSTSSYKFQDKDRYYERVIDDRGETWVNFWATWEGTLAANDQTLIIPVHATYQFNGDKIVEEHAFYNMAAFAMALTAIEADTTVTD